MACQMYINGRWCASESGREYDAINPATAEPFAKLPLGTREDARRAIASANVAAEHWAQVPLWERTSVVERMAAVLDAGRESLSETLCTELGKPLHGEARDETAWPAKHFRLAAELARQFEGSTYPVGDPNKRVLSIRQPKGVIAVITPWNFPLAIPSEYLPFALVAGNTVVWTPAPTAAVTAVKLMECLVEAGLSPGVINLVIGPGNEVGDELVVNPGTHAVAMTGSPRTGETISARCGLKPRLLEMGGNGPTIVLPDADPEMAAAAIAPACFYAAGQVCVSAERILVADKLKKPFVDAMVEQCRRWVTGDPRDQTVNVGPQNNATVLEKVKRHVEDAQRQGAIAVMGGHQVRRPGYFFEPTVLTDFRVDSLVNTEETFGPVAPIASFTSDEEAWRYINACRLGLTSAVFTRDLDRAWRWAEKIRTGIVVVNDSSLYWEPHLPFGGMAGSRSSIGRLGGRHTLEFMSDLKTIAFHVKKQP